MVRISALVVFFYVLQESNWWQAFSWRTLKIHCLLQISMEIAETQTPASKARQPHVYTLVTIAICNRERILHYGNHKTIERI